MITSALSAIWLFIKGVPPKVWLAIILVSAIAGAVLYYGHIQKNAGRAEVKAEWDAEKQAMARAAEVDRVMKQEGIDNVSSTFVAKTAQKATVNQVNSERLANYVTPTDPVLPGCFRLFHDAVAAGKELEYQCRGDAAAVPSATLAATVKVNYDGCNKNADQVELLQGIVKTLNGEAPH